VCCTHMPRPEIPLRAGVGHTANGHDHVLDTPATSASLYRTPSPRIWVSIEFGFKRQGWGLKLFHMANRRGLGFQRWKISQSCFSSCAGHTCHVLAATANGHCLALFELSRARYKIRLDVDGRLICTGDPALKQILCWAHLPRPLPCDGHTSPSSRTH